MAKRGALLRGASGHGVDAAGPPTANVLLLSGSHAPRPVVVMSFTSPTTPDVWTEKTAVFLLRAPGPALGAQQVLGAYWRRV